MSHPLSVEDVARYFLVRQDATVEPITPKKLQKLVYLAQGMSLALLHRSLWDTETLGARVTAWEEGPVVPVLYREYKSYRWRELPIPKNFDADAIDPTARAMMDAVLATYGRMSADQLTDLTHKHDPWMKAWAKAANPAYKPLGWDVIPEPEIADYFARLLTGPVDPRAMTPEELSRAMRSQPGWAEERERAFAQVEAGQGMSLGELRRFLGL
jgi:uncharacterized phage-associated protein